MSIPMPAVRFSRWIVWLTAQCLRIAQVHRKGQPHVPYARMSSQNTLVSLRADPEDERPVTRRL